MIIKELKVLSEALWESVKTDLVFFSPIQSFVRNLAEFNFNEITKEDVQTVMLYANKIEEFFKEYRPSGEVLYIAPHQTDRNDSTVKSILDLSHRLTKLSEEQLQLEVESVATKPKKKSSGEGLVFIGHGRSKLWARLQVYLNDELGLKTLSFETEAHTSESIVNILEDFLTKASYAILVLTAEDETIDGRVRARQNVIHEAGLFQGRLGFSKVVLLKQDKTEEFSNVDGLQYIGFAGDQIEQSFYELQRALRKSGLIK